MNVLPRLFLRIFFCCLVGASAVQGMVLDMPDNNADAHLNVQCRNNCQRNLMQCNNGHRYCTNCEKALCKYEVECVVCMDNPSQADKRVLKCGHNFCVGCLNRWFQAQAVIQFENGAQRRRTCPTCRKDYELANEDGCGLCRELAGNDGMPLLHRVINLGHYNMFYRVLEQDDIDVNAIYEGKTPVQLVVERSRLRMLQALHAKGAPLNDSRALSLAVKAGQRDIVDFLLQNGAAVHVNVHDVDTGKSLLHHAILSPEASNEIAFLLTAYGANTNFQDNDGKTPLHYAANRDKDLIVNLINNQASVKIYDNNGLYPLHYARVENCVQELLKGDVTINDRTRDGKTLLHILCAGQRDMSQLIRRLMLIYHAAYDAVDNQKRTPMHDAAANKSSLNSFNVLLQAGGSLINKQDVNGKTPTHNFIDRMKGFAENVFDGNIRVLKNGNADFFIKDNTGVTPYDLAVKLHKYSQEVRNLKLDKDRAARQEQLKTRQFISKIVAGGVLVGLAGTYIITLYYKYKQKRAQFFNEAVSAGNAKRVATMLNDGYDRDGLDSKGFAPLHRAAEKDQIEVAKILVKYGAQIDIPTKKLGDTPLQIAVKKNKPAFAKFLLGSRADVDATNKNGSTALHYAVLYDNVDIVELLFKRQADAFLINKDNKTAAQLVRERHSRYPNSALKKKMYDLFKSYKVL